VRAREQKHRESAPAEAEAARHQRRKDSLARRWARIGSVACADAYGARDYSRVELAYVEQDMARWATRATPLPAPREEALGTFALLEGRVRPGLFHAEVAP
jgi:hypothetical protein